jgi:MFS superfamily sulfate permease-like transporter
MGRFTATPVAEYLMRRLRLRLAADFVSGPAMLGFMNGAAVVTVSSQ